MLEATPSVDAIVWASRSVISKPLMNRQIFQEPTFEDASSPFAVAPIRATYATHRNHNNTIFLASETEGSSPYSQDPATGTYPEPTESTPPPSQSPPRSILTPSSNLTLSILSGLFHSGFTIKTLHFSLLSQAWYMPPPTSFSLIWSV
jgi:hypothetical protein